jgi:hypothetical protein
VPTTVTYDALQREGVAGGMPAELVAKVGEAVSKVCWSGCVRAWPWEARQQEACPSLACVAWIGGELPLVLSPAVVWRGVSGARTRAQGLQAMAIARAAGVKMAFGSDLLGAMHK